MVTVSRSRCVFLVGERARGPRSPEKHEGQRANRGQSGTWVGPRRAAARTPVPGQTRRRAPPDLGAGAGCGAARATRRNTMRRGDFLGRGSPTLLLKKKRIFPRTTTRFRGTMRALLALATLLAVTSSANAGCYRGRPRPPPPSLAESHWRWTPAPEPKHIPREFTWADVKGRSMVRGGVWWRGAAAAGEAPGRESVPSPDAIPSRRPRP